MLCSGAGTEAGGRLSSLPSLVSSSKKLPGLPAAAAEGPGAMAGGSVSARVAAASCWCRSSAQVLGPHDQERLGWARRLPAPTTVSKERSVSSEGDSASGEAGSSASEGGSVSLPPSGLARQGLSRWVELVFSLLKLLNVSLSVPLKQESGGASFLGRGASEPRSVQGLVAACSSARLFPPTAGPHQGPRPGQGQETC